MKRTTVEQESRPSGKNTTLEKIEFDGTHEILDYLLENTDGNNNSVKRTNNDWAGGTWDDMLNYGRNGWQYGTQQMKETLDKVVHHVEAETVGYHWDVTGQMFDVATMLTGEPEHWLEQHDEGERKFYKVVCSICYSASTKPHQMINRGAAIVALIDKLQSDRNNVVEVSVVANSAGIAHGKDYEIWNHLGSSPLDIDAVCFAIANPLAFRRMFFGTWEVETGKKHCGLYGSVRNPDGYNENDCGNGGKIYLGTRATGGGMPEFDTPESSAEWVVETLKKIEESRKEA